MKPSDLIKKEWQSKYLIYKELIWQHVIQLNMNIEIISKIRNFPFSLFGGINNHFWDVIFNSLYESSVLNISRLCIDPKPDCLTLLRFKNLIKSNLINEIELKKFKENEKNLAFDKKFRSIKKIIKFERDNRVAHLNRHNNEFSRKSFNDKLSIIENLLETRDLINELFHLCCFGPNHATLVIDYMTKEFQPNDRKTDLDEIFDLVIQSHVLFNMPEEQSAFWEVYKSNLTDEEFDLFNEYRKKYNKPLVKR